MNTARELTSNALAPVDNLAFRMNLRDRKPGALERLFRAYFDSIHRRVLFQVRNRELAEDLTQDIFLKIQRSLPGFNPALHLDPWIAAIVRNRIHDHWRARGNARDRLSLDQEEDLHSSFSAPDSTPFEQQAQSETEQVVHEAIHSLPASQREVVALRIYEGLSFDEIAGRLDVTAGTARKRYSRALNGLRSNAPLAHLHNTELSVVSASQRDLAGLTLEA